ncbi:antibiotic biosynthesis monooxygenase family protein [[Enterobacter] lignolyticus]|uniref:Antibiotic biosynthesis monooxygenase n=1 Tax=Enterobacter lignolyticus (strain SCF1) TaxID=701347 RepID=E3GCS3_ENTLS|nr:antibiotic biosynthesis monooxygenase [[Enterobacter] lignolyticus]ADO47853.1 Antibiotic biosynthesis monooxygenase [[Enterobacter] lignolyticus SCF1]
MIAVLFEAEVNASNQARYLSLAAELKPLLSDVEGFIAIERFQSLTTPGKILSLSWWRDEQAVVTWRENVLHKAAQEEGKRTLFTRYRIRIATVLREYQSAMGGE